MNECIESSNQSRWRQLYGSASKHNNAESCDDSSLICITDSFEDSNQMREWFDNLDANRITDQIESYPFNTEDTFQNTIQLIHSYDEDDPQRILDDVQDMIQQLDDDDDLMDSILESDRHQQAMIQFRREKKAKQCLRQWNLYTKTRMADLQFIATAIEDRRDHNIVLNCFQSWKKVQKQSNDFVNGFKRSKWNKLLRCIVKAWAYKIQEQMVILKVR